MTHDQKFMGPSSLSVNKRAIIEQLPPSNVFGFALRRIIHFIVYLPFKNSSSKIMISKLDYDAAYWRCHLSASSSLECCKVLRNSYSCISDSPFEEAHALYYGAPWQNQSPI